jgi:hypothetical protein
MSNETHREYTFCVLDFAYPDGQPYQTQKKAVQDEAGMKYEDKKSCTMKILDDEDKVSTSLLPPIMMTCCLQRVQWLQLNHLLVCSRRQQRSCIRRDTSWEDV